MSIALANLSLVASYITVGHERTVYAAEVRPQHWVFVDVCAEGEATWWELQGRPERYTHLHEVIAAAEAL